MTKRSLILLEDTWRDKYDWVSANKRWRSTHDTMFSIQRFFSHYRPAIQRKDGNKTSPKPVDPLEVARKLHRCNSTYKMIATAQAGDWEGRIDEARTRGDRKANRRQYCARHAAEMRKESNEKDRKRRENFQPLEENKVIRSFSSNYESDYENKIRHFPAKLGLVCLRHRTKLVVVGLRN